MAKHILDPSNGGYDIGLDLGQIVHVSFRDGHETLLHFEYFYWIEMGIDTALFEWWLGDPDFCLAYEEHCERVSQLEDDMEMQWEAFLDGIYNEVFYNGTDLEGFDER
ncbi:hypothetical protein LTR66_007135 [Elasticomyces elasticus]|nr:hypothetical protein LTR66_007135 [Elasticomyces elasticus]